MRSVSNQAGLYPAEIHRGTMVDGRRVETMTVGMINGHRSVTIRFAERDRKGRSRLSEPMTMLLGGQPVAGTRRPTTWAMPAGPVGHKPGTKLNGGWWGDGDANDRGDRTDRHHRKIESITYA